MAALRRERALIHQKSVQTSITTSLITDDDICVTMITAPSSDDNDNAQLFTLTVKSISQGRSTPLCLLPGLIWSGVGTQHKWEYRDRNSTSVKCVAFKARVKPKSQQARGERGMNAECDPSWADHYYGQGTHDTAASM